MQRRNRGWHLSPAPRKIIQDRNAETRRADSIGYFRTLIKAPLLRNIVTRIRLAEGEFPRRCGQEYKVSFAFIRARAGVTGLLSLALLGLALCCNLSLHAQEVDRKVKVRVQPEYPELAKRNNIRGIARVQLLVAADGKVKDAKVVGGSPVLAQAAVDACRKWKYEPASGESTLIVSFEFNP